MRSLSMLIAAIIVPLGLSAFAQSSETRSTATSDAVTLRLQSGETFTASRSAIPGGGAGSLSAMCCGTVDPGTMEGDNCAFLGAGRACAGDILACSGGEAIGADGKGFCVPAMVVQDR